MWYFLVLGVLFIVLPIRNGFVNVRLRNDLRRYQMESRDETKEYKPLKQLSIRFDCNIIDSDEISEILFELGVLSVSVEVPLIFFSIYRVRILLICTLQRL